MTGHKATRARRVRADSIRNRAAIVEAAAVTFSRRGECADVREIALQAGVAMGTLYRHFPTKEELLETILHDHSVIWEAEALRTTAAETDCWKALEEFLIDTVDRLAKHAALNERLMRPFKEWQFDECARRVASVAETVVARCHGAGLLRKGVTGEDILKLIVCLATLARSPSDASAGYPLDSVGEAQGGTIRRVQRVVTPWMRQLRIVLDGLRPLHGSLDDESRGLVP